MTASKPTAGHTHRVFDCFSRHHHAVDGCAGTYDCADPKCELAALRAKLLRVQEKLDGTIEERDVIAVECAARGDEVRRLDAVILDGRTIIYHSAFHDERVGDQYRYPQIRAWVVSAIPVREARALKEGEP